MICVRKMQTERCLMDIDTKSKSSGKFFLVCIFLILILLSSCATTLNYTASRPAKLAEYNIENIAVLPYEPKNTYSTSASPQAVMSMEILYNRICSSIVNGNYCSLIDSNAFNAAEDKSEVCDAYITFSVSQFYVYENFYLDDGSIYQWSSELSTKSFYNVDDYGRPLPVPLYVLESSKLNTPVQISNETKVSRHVDLVFNYSVVETATNKVITMEKFVISEESDTYKFGSILLEASSIIEKQLNNYADKIVDNFRPYNEVKTNTLIQDSKNENMKEANKLASKKSYGNLYAAKEIYFKEYKNNYNYDAAYNYSVICLCLNETDEAYEVMSEVCSETSNLKYQQLLEQIEKELHYKEILAQ